MVKSLERARRISFPVFSDAEKSVHHGQERYGDRRADHNRQTGGVNWGVLASERKRRDKVTCEVEVSSQQPEPVQFRPRTMFWLAQSFLTNTVCDENP